MRAYSILNVKEMNDGDETLTIKGIASTPTSDRMKDIVDPMGARFQTPMPLLWQHEQDKPIGQVTFANPTKKGIPFEAEIPKIKEEGSLKTRIDEAVQSIKYGLVKAVSIGFKPIDDAMEFLENGGIHFKEWEWYELSAVTIPANSEALITEIKSLDKEFLPSGDTEKSPGDTGTRKPILLKR